MKTNLTKVAVASLTALVIGHASAQESVSKPVGYETLNLVTGFNYIGLRLHEAPVISGEPTLVDGAVVTVADGVADALTPGETYILEVTEGDATGDTVLISSFDAANDTLTLSIDLSANLFPNDAVFTIRPSADLESVFGLSNSANLTSGPGLATSDQVWIPNGSGGYNKYFYGEGGGFGVQEGWKDSSENLVTAADVNLVYTNGIIVFALAPNDLVVSGSVKVTPTTYSLQTKFNLVGSVYPVGATLSSLFGAANESQLTSGPGIATSDQVWIPGVGGFEKYFYGEGGGFGVQEGWKDSAEVLVPDPADVDIPSGLIIFRQSESESFVFGSEPTFYANL